MIRDRSWPHPVILKYYLYQATVTYGFFWPVFTLFLLRRGLTFTQIGILGSVSAAFVVIGEIPTGYIGDYIGRRNTLIVGSVLLALSLFGFIVANSFAMFVLLWILWALGQAFQSGSGDAWLYDALKDQLREGEYTTVRGRGGSIDQWVSAGTMLAAGILYNIKPWVPFLAGGLLIFTSIPILLSMPTIQRVEDDDTLTIVEAIPLIRDHLTSPPLRSFVLYMAFFFAIIGAADEFIQPIAVRTLNLPRSGLGPLYAGFTVISAIASYYAGEIEELLSTRGAMFLIPLLVGILFVAPLFIPGVAFALFFTMKSANVVMRPIASGYINDYVESAGRATILSGASMIYALIRLPLKPLSGFIADHTTPIVALAALGTFFILVVLLREV